MENIRISLVQTDLKWENPEANRDRISNRIRHLEGQTDLIVLPEMFTTGFSMRPANLAESMDGPSIAWMADHASRLKAALCGSLIIHEGGKYFNRLIWMQPDGTVQHYDKKHLFTLAGEQEGYQAGQKQLLVKWKEWTIMPLICYDLRFPVWSRNTFNYDLLIYMASWPDKRVQAWQTLLTARAIENQAYVAGVNRVGEDGNGYHFNGHSTLVDHEGKLLYSCRDQENVFTGELSRTSMLRYRTRLPFLEDRDHFEISGNPVPESLKPPVSS